MSFFLKICLLGLLCNPFHVFALQNPAHLPNQNSQMLQDLDMIKHHLEVGYAPASWKKEYINWDLEEAYQQAKNQILAKPFLQTKQFQKIIRDFLCSMQDYHTSVLFTSTEEAHLPFEVKGAQGRYFITWIDRARLHSAYHPGINIGDELLEFGGQPIQQVVQELFLQNRLAKASTDQSLAEITLTHRIGLQGNEIPQGSVFIKIRSAHSGKIHFYQLMWDYTPESIHYFRDTQNELTSICCSLIQPKGEHSIFRNKGRVAIEQIIQPQKKPQLQKREIFIPSKISKRKATMINALHQTHLKRNRYQGGLGAYKSFLPNLGEIIWKPEFEDLFENMSLLESDEDISNDQSHEMIETPYASSLFHCYIYQHPEGYKIGYIRIPHYRGNKTDVEEFGKLINYLEENTNALVIDQINNVGGLVDLLYKISSILAIQPFKTPSHRLKITSIDVLEAFDTLEAIKNYSSFIDEEDEFPYQKMLFDKNHYEKIIESWNKGQTLTPPMHIEGVDWVTPHDSYRYTKPILMLINELCFSGGDFLPAILKDNDRVTLFGSQTAGAGGVVYKEAFPNQNGILEFSYTGSIAERADLSKIENLGVSPDVPYSITPEDIQYEYQEYVHSVNEAIGKLIRQKEKVMQASHIVDYENSRSTDSLENKDKNFLKSF